MEQITLFANKDSSEDRIQQARAHLIRAVCIRATDIGVCSIKHMRMPKWLVTDEAFQEELERYIPTLVLP